MKMQPQSELLEDTISLEDSPHRPHTRRTSSEEWYSWGENSETEYQKGIRFCALYRKDTRSRREEAELGTAYWGAYQAAFTTVARIAHKAGLHDSELISDCAAGLVDFCARQYDETAVGRDNRPKSFFAYLKNIAFAYLRKHRDFLAFAKKMTGTGFSSQDLMTVATFGREEDRLERASASEYDHRDVFDTLDPDAVESLYAEEWTGFAVEEYEGEDAGQVIETMEEHLPETLRDWVDYLLDQVRHSGLSPALLAVRVPAILEQLKSATGARLMDIIKRLIARMKSGCREALDLLRALRATIPGQHERTLNLIDEVLDSIETASQPLQRENCSAMTAVHGPAPQQVTLTQGPDIADPGEIHPRVTDAVAVCKVLDTAAESDTPDSNTQPVGYDSDLGFLIDVSDLRHGRVPPAKARFMIVETPPADPPGTPPRLDEDPGPGKPGPTEDRMVFLDRRVRRLQSPLLQEPPEGGRNFRPPLRSAGQMAMAL
ncbi:hypothetical protein ACQUQQ_00840 [Acidithiobacillus ferrooxidans]|jgi:hypothetical protein|uniref:hypothetical protein n=1 Tax=Acidithiobacillus TaxID=119977 RepID=UPI000A8B66F9|nr:hypothetical protein [Acidithiobacillus ferridurans]MBU2805357.1 hypothetical protein [Acidithiobacillus ferridurans]